MSSQSLVLYECPATCSDRVKVLLEEMQIPYEKKTYFKKVRAFKQRIFIFLLKNRIKLYEES